MAKIDKFEDLEVWKKAREYCKEIYSYSNVGSFSKDFELIKQIRRSSGSIMDNIAEGFERDGSKEFKQFLSIAKGSSGEVLSQLYRAKDQNYISEETFQNLYNIGKEISKMLYGLIEYLKKTDYDGTKYKK